MKELIRQLFLQDVKTLDLHDEYWETKHFECSFQSTNNDVYSLYFQFELEYTDVTTGDNITEPKDTELISLDGVHFNNFVIEGDLDITKEDIEEIFETLY